MLNSMGFPEAAQGWELPMPGSNRGYSPLQLIEKFMVDLWCGASRFVHAETVGFDRTLTRLFGWNQVAGHKSIVRLFERFTMLRNERVQALVYRWFFSKIASLKRKTIDLDSTVITRHGEQEGATRGYNPGRRGHPGHHPLFAFIAEARMGANFWLRPGHAHSANNTLSFHESTLHHLGVKVVGLLRADNGFFEEKILSALEGKSIPYIIAARLTWPIQKEIRLSTGWWAVAPGLELTEIAYQAQSWEQPRRMVVVRQSIRRKAPQG